VIFDGKSCSFFVDDIGQDRVFFSCGDVMFFSIIREFVPRLLPHHALLDSFFTSAKFLSVFSSSIDAECWIDGLLHTFVSYFGKSEFERFSIWTWDRLDQTQDSLYISDICLVIFPIRSYHFQLVTICNHLRSFFLETIFENFSIISRISTIWSNCYNIHYRKISFLSVFVSMTTDVFVLKEGEMGGGHSDVMKCKVYGLTSGWSLR